MSQTLNHDELKAKLLELGFTQEQIDEAEETDGSFGLSDLADTSPKVQLCDYLGEGEFYLCCL
jgi:hypothetical protein